MTNQPIGAMNQKQSERIQIFVILITFCSSVFAVGVYGVATNTTPNITAGMIMLVPGVSAAFAYVFTRIYIPKLNEKWAGQSGE